MRPAGIAKPQMLVPRAGVTEAIAEGSASTGRQGRRSGAKS